MASQQDADRLAREIFKTSAFWKPRCLFGRHSISDARETTWAHVTSSPGVQGSLGVRSAPRRGRARKFVKSTDVVYHQGGSASTRLGMACREIGVVANQRLPWEQDGKLPRHGQGLKSHQSRLNEAGTAMLYITMVSENSSISSRRTEIPPPNQTRQCISSLCHLGPLSYSRQHSPLMRLQR